MPESSSEEQTVICDILKRHLAIANAKVHVNHKHTGATSRSYLVEIGSTTPTLFVKKICKYETHDVYEREKHMAGLLGAFSWYPRLLCSVDEEQILVFRYAGKPLTNENRPRDVAEQFGSILEDLASVNVQHNDIKNEELLVEAGQLRLCDFGWASVGNDLSCGLNIWGGIKPFGYHDDATALQRCGFADEKSPSKYMDKRRNGVGSQSEVSTVRLVGSDCCTFGGYQRFDLTADEVVPKSQAKKYRALQNWFRDHDMSGKVVYDIGANNGVVAYMASMAGCKSVHALDHDEECIQNMKQANNHLGIRNVLPVKYNFGETTTNKADITVAMAIIHWVYSCTAHFGSLERIVGYLKSMTREHLIVEWVAPDDCAIRSFNHLSFNEMLDKEPYTLEKFEQAIATHGGRVVDRLPTDKCTRTTYVVQF